MFGIYVSISDAANAIGCLILGAITLLCCLLFFGWLIGISESQNALRADVPGSIHTVADTFSGPADTWPSTMPCFRSKADLARWIFLSEKDAKGEYYGDEGMWFADKHQLLQLNGGERVRILEQDGQTLRVRVLPLPRGETTEDFPEVGPHDVGQRCYTVDEHDLFAQN